MTLFDDVHRIAVLRGGGLGDLVFALPACQALRDAYPEAELTLLGTPAHAAIMDDRPGPIDRVVPLPTAKGVHEAPGPDAEEFFRWAQAERFDLAVQAHGGGRWSNPFLLRLGARHTIGTRTPDAVAPERWLPYRYHQHEAMRWLELVGLAGATGDFRAHLAVTDTDRKAADSALAGLPRPLVTLHPGATDQRRRWPCFGRLAERLTAAGLGVAVLGTPDEADLVADVARGGARGLAGELDLSGLVGVLAASDVVVANDSGPRHLAEAAGTPTVSVFWCANVINAAPFTRERHRVHISWTVRCPVCGVSLTDLDGPTCEHQESWVGGVPLPGVLADTLELLGFEDSVAG